MVTDSVQDSTAHQTVTETQRTGPETITTTVEEFGPSSPSGSDPRAEAQSTNSAGSQDSLRGRVTAVPPPGLSSAPILPFRRVLVKRTITIDQRSPSLTESKLEGSAASETRKESKVDLSGELDKSLKPAGILGSLLGLWPFLLIGALALAGVIGWRILKSRLP